MSPSHRGSLLFAAAVFLSAFLLIASRRPDALTRAVFYAEDGLVWYTQAYVSGPWHALLLPRDGYLQTLPRLVAGLSLLVPLAQAPFVMNLAGLLIQALPVAILVSPRMAPLGPLALRVVLAALYIALPNAAELHASITEAHWHLALAACLLLLARPPQNLLSRSFDLLLLLLCGLSGPFALPLALVACVRYWFTRESSRNHAPWPRPWSAPWSVWTAALFSLCAAFQGTTLLLSRSRPRGTLGATPLLFLQILAAQIYAGSLVGRNAMHRRGDLALFAVALLGAAILIYCFVKSNLEWRLFLVFCLAVFAGSLANPNAGHGPSQWAAMSGSWDNRYWFFPMLAFVWSVAWCAFSARTRFMQVPAIGLLMLTLVYLPKNWPLKPEDNVHFREAAARWDRVRPGEKLTLPILPVPWTMELTKLH